MEQIHPNPNFNPGFRVGLDGRAVFLLDGFRVDIHVRPASPEGMPYTVAVIEPRDVVITGSIALDGVRLCEVYATANEDDPFNMRDALSRVLNDAVGTARCKADNLVALIRKIDQRNAGEGPSGEGSCSWPSAGDTVLVQDVPTTAATRELWATRKPPSRKGQVVESPAQRDSALSIDCGGEWGVISYAAGDFSQRYTWMPAVTEEATA
ncbi:hypothetical protein [Streptomyces sp. NPDC051572]|uniref:hypothetical protein n=1 Tax=Streptomyces sp. NPDC051572 TaxID=3155802 RepID=UPI00344D72C2